MAGGATSWRSLVDHNHAPVAFLLVLVTEGAWDALMRSRQRKTRAGLVVEGAGPPTRQGMARRAIQGSGGSGELTAMNVFMTSDAVCGRSVEERRSASCARIGGPVTLHAGNTAMRALEREPGLGMIEVRQILPGTRDVTISARTPHGLELALVRIGMASLAAQRIKAIAYRRLRFRAAWRRPQLVAIVARDGPVAAVEREAGLLMLGHCELRRTKACYGVTALATVAERRTGELTGVRIAVTILAGVGLQLVDSLNAGGHMALLAVHLGMLTQQRVRRFLVVGLSEL